MWAGNRVVSISNPSKGSPGTWGYVRRVLPSSYAQYLFRKKDCEVLRRGVVLAVFSPVLNHSAG